MDPLMEADISTAIVEAYYQKLQRALRSDVVIVGAGPSGLTAAWKLASCGVHVIVLEKRLSPGGGIWGGSMGMNEVIVQAEALDIIKAAGVTYRARGSLFTIDALELASALCLRAVQAGATIFNLIAAEDVCVRDARVTGIAANRSLILERLPVDPLVFTARAVLDATGHEAAVAGFLARRGHLEKIAQGGSREEAMDAPAGEAFVVDHAGEIFPGLWIAGMSVCAMRGGPRMGPIFGGMLMSGVKVAKDIVASLEEAGGG